MYICGGEGVMNAGVSTKEESISKEKGWTDSLVRLVFVQEKN